MMKNNTYEISQRFLGENRLMIIHNNCYVYNGKYYEQTDISNLRCLIYESMTDEERAATTATSDVKKIIEHLLMQKELIVDDYPHNERYICCNNGVVDIKGMKLLPHSPEYRCMFCIDANYTEQPREGEVFEGFLKDLFEIDEFDYKNISNSNVDEGGINSLQECLGYFISDCSKAKQMTILSGVANSGKSVLLSVLEHLVGRKNVSNVNMSNINDEFYLAHLCENRINICYDTKQIKLKDISNIKLITSPTDSITVRKPYGEPYSSSRKPKLIFACNTLPELILSAEERDAYFARVIVFMFNNKISKKRQNPNLINELLAEKDFIFKWLIAGYKQYLENGYEFSESKSLKENKRLYKHQYDIVNFFVEDNIKFKTGKKVFSVDLERALKKYIEKAGLEYSPQYKTELFTILKNNSVEHKRIKIDGESRQGFYGVKLKK